MNPNFKFPNFAVVRCLVLFLMLFSPLSPWQVGREISHPPWIPILRSCNDLHLHSIISIMNDFELVWYNTFWMPFFHSHVAFDYCIDYIYLDKNRIMTMMLLLLLSNWLWKLRYIKASHRLNIYAYGSARHIQFNSTNLFKFVDCISSLATASCSLPLCIEVYTGYRESKVFVFSKLSYPESISRRQTIDCLPLLLLEQYKHKPVYTDIWSWALIGYDLPSCNSSSSDCNTNTSKQRWRNWNN